MKTITIQQAHEILQNSAAVIWDDNFLTYPDVQDLTGEDDNEFLHLSITDEEGQVFEANFNEGNNKEVRVEGTSLFLKDDGGEDVQVSVLAAVDAMGLLSNKGVA